MMDVEIFPVSLLLPPATTLVKPLFPCLAIFVDLFFALTVRGSRPFLEFFFVRFVHPCRVVGVEVAHVR